MMNYYDANFGFVPPNKASITMLIHIGLDAERFQNDAPKRSWALVVQSYFNGYVCDEAVSCDNAEDDFVAMGFTREAAIEAKAFYGKDYGHLCPWDWAPEFLTYRLRKTYEAYPEYRS
jgi:hypothetical protein